MKMKRYQRALDEGTAVVGEVRPADLARPSPCAGWDLRDLLEHMVGQNHGFAEAVEHAGRADVGVAAFAPRPVTDDVPGTWQPSADRIAAAFGVAAPDAELLLPEVSTVRRLPVATVLEMHLLDTVVHTWDVATALGRAHRPADDLVAAVAEVAPMVADGPVRERPGASFAPVRTGGRAGGDVWTSTLAWLGRDAAPS